ncbi:MAG: shikimate kinase, partial [Chloroflexota bacterium]
PRQPAIGRAVAEKLGRRLVNVEQMLEERSGMAADDILATYGQARLTDLENAVMNDVVLFRGAVVRVSGEMLAHGDNLERLAVTGPVVCLVAALDAVLQRLHLSMGARYHNPAERDLALGNLRKAWAVRGQPSVHEVDATYLNEDETVAAVVGLWQELSLKRA